LIVFLLSGCIEPFTPPSANFLDLLVVEAFITDQPSSHFVKLSRSYPINEFRGEVESGATVSITSSNGSQIVFSESEPGMYLATGFQPIIGDSYVLNITTRDGSIYASNPVVMKETPEIENIYYERKSKPSKDVEGLDDGYQIFLDSKESEENQYLRFTWEETWEFRTPFTSFLEFNLETNRHFIREVDISNCWRYSESTEINVATNEGKIANKIKGQSIRYVSFNEPTLRIKYSLLIKQFSLDESSFRFWENLKESNESAGTLYDTQPFQIASNITNLQDSSIPILGIFEMTTESSQRIFITKNELPKEIFITTLYSECFNGVDAVVSVVSVADIPEYLAMGYLIETTVPVGRYTVVPEKCIDCRFKGSNSKPEFWE